MVKVMVMVTIEIRSFEGRLKVVGRSHEGRMKVA